MERLYELEHLMSLPEASVAHAEATRQLLNLLTHWQWMVTTAVENGPFHFTVHLVMVTAGFIMWIPVCGPWPEYRLSMPGQMVYLFLMSVFPTLPAAWLANSDSRIVSCRSPSTNCGYSGGAERSPIDA